MKKKPQSDISSPFLVNMYVYIFFNLSTDSDMVMEEEIDIGALKSYSAPDILICGNCR